MKRSTMLDITFIGMFLLAVVAWVCVFRGEWLSLIVIVIVQAIALKTLLTTQENIDKHGD